MSDSTAFWINGRLCTEDEAVIPVMDHGLLYGDGVFEGIRFYNGRPFRLEAHLRRLAASCAAIALPLPRGLPGLADAVDELISSFPRRDGYLRLIVTRGAGSMGLDPTACGEPNVILIATSLRLVQPNHGERGIRLITAATRRLSPDGLDPRIKSLNYLNNILARMEANRAGADEAVLLNRQGRVAEGSAENIFIVRDGVLSTPRPVDGALEGITRQLVLDLAESLGMPSREAALTPYDLYTADECFLSGTGAELVPVEAVDGRPVGACPGPRFSALESAFRRTIERETGGSSGD